MNYWILSEVETHPSKPQQYVSETRMIHSAVTARDWRDFTEKQYRDKGDNREVILVQVLDARQINERIERECK